MPAVSVIIPVYGVEKYIERCARSLFEQTMEDLEYIFVDDYTPDASMDILARVMDDYPARRCQVKVLHNEVNRGLAYTRRRGVEASTGDYIIHCDSDDYVEKDIYEKLYAKATEEGLDMVLCQMCIVAHGRIERYMDKLGVENPVGALIRQDICNHLMDKLISRKAYDKGIVFPHSNIGEDYVMCIQLACNCDSFGYVFEPLYNYVVREGSLINSKDTIPKINQIKESLDLAFSCLEARGLVDKYKKDIEYTKCWLKSIIQGFPRDYYMGVYPEVNRSFLFNRDFGVMFRLGHLTKLMGIHGISKVFSRK